MLTLKTFNPAQPGNYPFSFYILNKGNNSGKPLENPCPNCFIAICKDEAERNFYFWLCWGLWRGKQFEHFLYGSVIMYIRIKDAKDLITAAADKLPCRQEYLSAVNQVQLWDARQKNMRQQLHLIDQLKRGILAQHLANKLA